MKIQSQNTVSANNASTTLQPIGIGYMDVQAAQTWQKAMQDAAAKMTPAQKEAATKAGEQLKHDPLFKPPSNAVEEGINKMVQTPPGISTFQKILLGGAYEDQMRKLQGQGISLSSQDPALILQQVVQLASEFEANITGVPSKLMNIAQQDGLLPTQAATSA